MPSITDLAFTKTYDDLEILDEADLDNAYNSIQIYINDKVKDNLVQLATDSMGTDYTFTDDGVPSFTNTVYAKQFVTDSHSGGDTSLGLLVDGVYSTVDAVNLSLTFTPERTGQYRAVFTFTHAFALTAVTEGQCETSFRISDGVSNSFSVRSGGYLPAPVANQGRLSHPISITHVFNFTDTSTRTIVLQKQNLAMTAVATNIVGGSTTNGEFFAVIEKI